MSINTPFVRLLRWMTRNTSFLLSIDLLCRAAAIRKACATASKGATNHNLQSASCNAGDLAASMSAMDLASASDPT